jgi:hypothetical protein
METLIWEIKMFDLGPITTTNLLSVLQILVVIVGFYFSWRSLEAARGSLGVAATNLEIAGKNLGLSTSNAQAQLFNQMVVQGRDLQYKFMDIYYGGNSAQEIEDKRKLYTGTVIGYYASCFELKSVLPMPPNVAKLLEAELGELMRQKSFREKWDEVKHLHSHEFARYVDGMRGIK